MFVRVELLIHAHTLITRLRMWASARHVGLNLNYHR